MLPAGHRWSLSKEADFSQNSSVIEDFRRVDVEHHFLPKKVYFSLSLFFAMLCSMQDLCSPARIEPMLPALGVWVLTTGLLGKRLFISIFTILTICLAKCLMFVDVILLILHISHERSYKHSFPFHRKKAVQIRLLTESSS